MPGDGYENSVDEHFIVTPSDHCRIDDYVIHYYNSVRPRRWTGSARASPSYPTGDSS